MLLDCMESEILVWLLAKVIRNLTPLQSAFVGEEIDTEAQDVTVVDWGPQEYKEKSMVDIV